MVGCTVGGMLGRGRECERERGRARAPPPPARRVGMSAGGRGRGRARAPPPLARKEASWDAHRAVASPMHTGHHPSFRRRSEEKGTVARLAVHARCERDGRADAESGGWRDGRAWLPLGRGCVSLCGLVDIGACGGRRECVCAGVGCGVRSLWLHGCARRIWKIIRVGWPTDHNAHLHEKCRCQLHEKCRCRLKRFS